MGPLAIASLIAMLGGAYVQNRAASDAASNAKRVALQNAQRQDDWSRQAEKKALDRANEYNTDTRQQEQAGIEQDLTQQYMAPVESAQAINAAATTTQGEVSNDYKNAHAQSQLNIVKNARQLAGLTAKVNAANRLRGNEAIRMSDTGMDLDRMANFSNREGQIGQFEVQAAGRPDAGMMAAGSLLQGAGAIGLAGGFSSAGNATPAPVVEKSTYLTTPAGLQTNAPIGPVSGVKFPWQAGYNTGSIADFGRMSWT